MVPTRSRRILNGIALFVSLTITLGVPTGFMLLRGMDEVEMLTFRTRIAAGRAGRYIYVHEQVWRYQSVRLAELIEIPDSPGAFTHQRLVTADGHVVLEDAGSVPWPAFAIAVPIDVGGRTVGQLEARTSQRPLLLTGAIVTVVSALVGFAAWAAVRLLPMRALDRAMAELVEQQSRIRAAAEASKAKSGFLAMMSHEIRTPMNAVLGLTSSLMDDRLSPSQRKVVEAIRESGDDLLRILNDILDFSKLDADRMTFEHAAFAPAVLTDGVVSMLSSRAAAKHLHIAADCGSDVPAGLSGDAGRIRQVLLNLVSNAVKFTQSGEVRVAMRCVSQDATAATVEWAVSDTGIGIAADRIGSLFGEFMQADTSISRRFGGTGLGLAISKRLVDQMGGRIDVTSTPGQGTTFRVRLTLPLGTPQADTMTHASDVVAQFAAVVAALGHLPRILLAEDNTTNQFVVRRLLKGMELQLDVVSDGQEAVTAAKQFAYDAIFMDMQMPEMDGLAATRLIRASGGALATIPIIALTANAFADDVRACQQAGMNDFVAKPVNRQILLAALLRCLGRPEQAHGTAAPRDDTDTAALAALTEDLGEAGVAEAVELFLVETAARLVRLGTPALDAATAVREAHSLKGAAATVGAISLSTAAASLEARLKAGAALGPADIERLARLFDGYRAVARPFTHRASHTADGLALASPAA